MGKWGWMVISIGCIVMMSSATLTSVSLPAFCVGLAIVAIGGIMCYMSYKEKK